MIYHTVWKFENISATQISREINLGKSRISKKVSFWQFWFLEITKVAFLETLNLPRSISRNICLAENFFDLHTVYQWTKSKLFIKHFSIFCPQWVWCATPLWKLMETKIWRLFCTFKKWLQLIKTSLTFVIMGKSEEC